MKSTAFIISALLYASVAFGSFHELIIPEVGPTCVIDPVTGQCVPEFQEEQGSLPEVPELPPFMPSLEEAPSVPDTPSQEIAESFEETEPFGFFEGIASRIRDLRTDPSVQRIIDRVVAPVSITVAGASAGILLVTIPSLHAQISIHLGQLFDSLNFLRFYILGLVRLRKRRPWGRVVDKLTGEPIARAKVQLYASEFSKLVDAAMTDGEGRFEFVVRPGTYFVKVGRKGFREEVSERIRVTSDEQALDIEIALVPLLQEIGLSYIKRLRVLNFVSRVIYAINPYLLAVGTALSASAAVVRPNSLNYAVLGLYLALDALKIYFTFHLAKPSGVVQDAGSGNPIPLAVVRIYDRERSWLVSTKVTDRDGHFNFLLASGRYYITCMKNGYTAQKIDSYTVKRAGSASIVIQMKKN